MISAQSKKRLTALGLAADDADRLFRPEAVYQPPAILGTRSEQMARKGAAKARAGQALRGSSEFHAWGDSNLYLRRVGEQLTLAVEQRAAAST